MKSLVSLILALGLASTAHAAKTELTCPENPNTPNGRVAGLFKLIVDGSNLEQIMYQIGSGAWVVGTLEQVGTVKYIAHYPRGKKNTYWFFAKSQTLSLYDASTGFIKYDCRLTGSFE